MHTRTSWAWARRVSDRQGNHSRQAVHQQAAPGDSHGTPDPFGAQVEAKLGCWVICRREVIVKEDSTWVPIYTSRARHQPNLPGTSITALQRGELNSFVTRARTHQDSGLILRHPRGSAMLLNHQDLKMQQVE